MNITNLKETIKKATENNRFVEYGATVFLGVLMIIQRLLSREYKPVMDDWFLFGDLYKNISDRITLFAIPNEKFSIRPIAGLLDCFLNAPLFNNLWIPELILTLSLLIGAVLISATLRKNHATISGFFLCLICLFPVGLEATYWISAATRISYSILFIGISIYALNYYYKTKLKCGLIFYSIFGLICVGFYEPAIIIYIILTSFVIWNNFKNRNDIFPLFVMAAHIICIVLYYVFNSGTGEVEIRGGIIKSNIISHTILITKYIYNIIGEYSIQILKHGFKSGQLIVLGGHKFLKMSVIAIASIMFGIFSTLLIKKHKFSLKILILGIVLLVSGVSLNYILASDRIPLRLVYFSYIGAGIILDELIVLIPYSVNRFLYAFSIALLAFVFTISGIGEVNEYIKTSELDVDISRQLLDLDTDNNIINVDKNTYVFGGQHYYINEYKCASYLDHIRGASGNYSDITGCIRHLTNTTVTNNIMPFTYGDTEILKPYIDIEGLCDFYSIEYDRTVIKVTISPDGDDYDILREDGSSIGKLIKIDDVKYQFIN